MSDYETLAEFAANPDPRCPCVLLLDTSASMNGTAITALNSGLLAFQQDIQQDSLARRRVEVALVTFGHDGVQTAQDFVTAGEFQAPVLIASGQTPMGAGITWALDLLQARKATYKANGIIHYRPWVFLITDGEPTDEWQTAAARVRAEETAHRLAFFAVGVDGANMTRLAEIAVRPPLKLNGTRFTELFVWLSRSQRSVSSSRVGEQVTLPPVGWSAV